MGSKVLLPFLGFLLLFHGAICQLSETERQRFLVEHNKYRCMHDAPLFTWSSCIEQGALEWANRNKFENSNSFNIPPCGGPAAENVAKGFSTITAVVGAWYQKNSLFNFEDPIFSNQAGQFSALIWQGAKEIGCGRNKNLYVCRYKGDDVKSCNTPNIRECTHENVLRRNDKTEQECLKIAMKDYLKQKTKITLDNFPETLTTPLSLNTTNSPIYEMQSNDEIKKCSKRGFGIANQEPFLVRNFVFQIEKCAKICFDDSKCVAASYHKYIIPYCELYEEVNDSDYQERYFIESFTRQCITKKNINFISTETDLVSPNVATLNSAADLYSEDHREQILPQSRRLAQVLHIPAPADLRIVNTEADSLNINNIPQGAIFATDATTANYLVENHGVSVVSSGTRIREDGTISTSFTDD